MGGRGKLSLKFMSNRKSRISTFKKRKNCLMKKAYELSTLCDVRICVLVHGPASAPDEDRSQSQSDVEFHTWPPNRTEIEPLIRAYKNNNPLHQKRKCFNLNNFFLDRKSKVQTDICKLRQNAEEVLCPNPKWDDWLDGLSEHQLRAFMDGLDSKIQAATGMIGFMEADYHHLLDELPIEFSSQNSVEMGGDLNNPPMEMPALVELDFPEFSVSPNENAQYNFEPLELDFPEFSVSTNGDAQYNFEPLELDFPEFSVSPNGDAQYNFEPLQSLFEEDDDSDVTQFINLMNDGIDQYSNDLEYLMMGGVGIIYCCLVWKNVFLYLGVCWNSDLGIPLTDCLPHSCSTQHAFYSAVPG